jgi:hypothetical protein
MKYFLFSRKVILNLKFLHQIIFLKNFQTWIKIRFKILFYFPEIEYKLFIQIEFVLMLESLIDLKNEIFSFFTQSYFNKVVCFCNFQIESLN